MAGGMVAMVARGIATSRIMCCVGRGIEMFYAEFGVTVYATHRSLHLAIRHRCYEVWCNVRFLHCVSYDDVVWC